MAKRNRSITKKVKAKRRKEDAAQAQAKTTNPNSPFRTCRQSVLQLAFWAGRPVAYTIL